MKIMSTHGIVPGSSCHYEPTGYQVFSDLIGPLVEQDVYGDVPPAPNTAPNLQQAYFTTAARNEIALVFDQNVAWNPGAPTMLFLANANGATSGSLSSGSATDPDKNASGLLPTMAQDGGQWVFEYNHNDDSLPPATTQVVQYGSDLTGWTDITIPATSSGAVTITPDAPADHVRVVIPNLSGKVFARLKVVAAP